MSEFITIAVIIWLAVVNVMAIILYWRDKRQAVSGGNSRISETTLLTVAAIGGSPACILAARKFRHKTRKLSFKLKLYAIIIIQLALVAGGIWYYLRG